MAVLLMNNGEEAASNLGFEWADVPGLGHVHGVDTEGCVVYDVWRREGLGRVKGPRFVVKRAVPPRGSAFVTLAECGRSSSSNANRSAVARTGRTV